MCVHGRYKGKTCDLICKYVQYMHACKCPTTCRTEEGKAKNISVNWMIGGLSKAG